MENNPKFSQVRTYFRVLDRDHDYLGHAVSNAVMQVSLHRSQPGVDAIKNINQTSEESNFHFLRLHDVS